MKIIKRTPNESGAFSPMMQDWHGEIPSDWIAVNCDTAVFYQYMGFVTLTVENDVVTSMTANEDAYQSYIDSLPEPEPEQTTTEDITLEMLADHEERICMMEIMS